MNAAHPPPGRPGDERPNGIGSEPHTSLAGDPTADGVVSGNGEDRTPPWIVLVALLVGLCAAILSSIVVALIGQGFGVPAAHPTPAVSIITSVVFDLSFVASALYFTVLRGGWGPQRFGYRRVPFSVGAKAVVTGGVVYYAVSFLYGALLDIHGQDKLPSSFGIHRSTAALLGTAAFVCVVAPICEEFFFRGFMFGVLRKMRIRLGHVDLGPWVAAVLVGILFGLAHTGSVSSDQYLIPLGFLGFVLCIIRWRTGSLYPCMALHAFNNSLAMGVLLGWTLAGIAALLLCAWALIALVTWPLSTLGVRVAAGSS